MSLHTQESRRKVSEVDFLKRQRIGTFKAKWGFSVFCFLSFLASFPSTVRTMQLEDFVKVTSVLSCYTSQPAGLMPCLQTKLSSCLYQHNSADYKPRLLNRISISSLTKHSSNDFPKITLLHFPSTKQPAFSTEFLKRQTESNLTLR